MLYFLEFMILPPLGGSIAHTFVQIKVYLFLSFTINLEFEVEQEGIDMCKAMEMNNLKREVTGAIRIMQKLGANNDDIIKAVTETFNVTKEYVLDLMKAQVA